VFDLDEWLLALLAVGVICGAWSVWHVRGNGDPRRAAWGRRVFLACLSLLGGASVVAVMFAARALVPLGLAAGWLVIAMLWENPFRVWQEG
jgi:hypothetical protein